MSLQQVLAPQLQQSLALLQAPTLELKALVEQELQQNPVLEEVVAEEVEHREKRERDAEGHTDIINVDPSEPPPDVNFDPAKEKPSNEPVDDFQAEFERLTQLDQEWRDHFAQTNLPMRQSAEEDEKRQYMFDSLVAGTSLQENLLEQMRLSDISEEQRPIAELIIGNIDDYGYLKISVEELAVWLSNHEVTFTKTDGATFALGFIARWSENYNPETFNQPRTVRRQVTRTVQASGYFLADPKMPESERQAFLLARRDQWLALTGGTEGTLIRHTTFNRVVRVLQFTAQINPAFDAIQWSITATYGGTTDEPDFAAAEVTIATTAAAGAPEKSLLFSGRIASPKPEAANAKLESLRAATLEVHEYSPPQRVRAEMRQEKIGADDGGTFIELVFDEEYRSSNGRARHWVQPQKILDVLRIIQSFHPPGVGARDLRECLLLQLEREGRRKTLEFRIVDQYMDALGKRRLPEIARGLGESVDETQKAAGRIGLLEPRPGRAFLPDNDQYILPEVFVVKAGDDFAVTTNNEQIPHLRISNTYKDLMAQADSSPEVRDYIREKIRAGKFLIKSLQQRQQTILNIAKEIVKRQREFMEKGVAFLKPLTMVQVAEVVGVHETTVSRAVSGKYMETPQGIFEMKYFFTSGIQTASGEGMSNTSVKDMIADLFGKEDPHKPLSDQEVVKILGDKGIQIARRTVAKYRSELNILPSNLRKVY
jgi:RNA polymerase sigma-54 factor